MAPPAARVSGLRDRGERPGLALKPLLPIGIGGDVRREDFDRDGAIETCVARPQDLPHPAGANERDDFISAESSTRRERHGLEVVAGLYGQFSKRARHR